MGVTMREQHEVSSLERGRLISDAELTGAARDRHECCRSLLCGHGETPRCPEQGLTQAAVHQPKREEGVVQLMARTVALVENHSRHLLSARKRYEVKQITTRSLFDPDEMVHILE
jgi:hypothetical protein